MKFGQRQLRYALPGRGAVTFLMAGLLAIGSGSAVAKARASEPQHGRIVALGFDAGNQMLLKAYSRARYRSANGGRVWEPISLPTTIAHGRIASVAASAHRKNVLYVAGPGFGVLRSENGGRNWVAVNAGLPSNNVVALAS